MTDEEPRPRAATGHMPFTGHRTCETVFRQQEAGKRRWRERMKLREAMEYGFDPEVINKLPAV